MQTQTGWIVLVAPIHCLRLLALAYGCRELRRCENDLGQLGGGGVLAVSVYPNDLGVQTSDKNDAACLHKNKTKFSCVSYTLFMNIYTHGHCTANCAINNEKYYLLGHIVGRITGIFVYRVL